MQKIGIILALTALCCANASAQTTKNNNSPIAVSLVSIPTPASVATKAHFGGTVTTANTFQQIVAADPTRHGCLIQNTSSNNEYLFYQGAVEIPSTAQSFILQPYAFFGCRASDGSPIKDALWITSATAGSAYNGQAQ